jgi:hypothetical protein
MGPADARGLPRPRLPRHACDLAVAHDHQGMSAVARFLEDPSAFVERACRATHHLVGPPGVGSFKLCLEALKAPEAGHGSPPHLHLPGGQHANGTPGNASATPSGHASPLAARACVAFSFMEAGAQCGHGSAAASDNTDSPLAGGSAASGGGTGLRPYWLQESLAALGCEVHLFLGGGEPSPHEAMRMSPAGKVDRSSVPGTH